MRSDPKHAQSESQSQSQSVQSGEGAHDRSLDPTRSDATNAQPQSQSMGLLKHLLFWPVTGPKFLTEFSLGKVADVVREELTDDARVKSELMELQLQLELGDIDDAEYVRRETELMAQLREIREWREHFGMGVAGGPVRVQSVGEPAAASPSAPAPSSGESVADVEEADRAPRVARPGGATIEFNLDLDG